MKHKSEAKTSAWWKALDGCAEPQEYPPGVALLRQAALPREVFVIRRGLAKLVCLDEEGREVILGLRGTGWLLGGAAVVLGEPSPISAVTLTICELQRLAARDFLALLETDGAFAGHWQRLQCRENLAQMQRAVELRCWPARQRLEQLLWQMAGALGATRRNARMQLPLQYQELADLIAVTPAYLSRLFGQLERAGLLRREKGWLVLPDPGTLWHARGWADEKKRRPRADPGDAAFDDLLI